MVKTGALGIINDTLNNEKTVQKHMVLVVTTLSITQHPLFVIKVVCFLHFISGYIIMAKIMNSTKEYTI